MPGFFCCPYHAIKGSLKNLWPCENLLKEKNFNFYFCLLPYTPSSQAVMAFPPHNIRELNFGNTVLAVRFLVAVNGLWVTVFTNCKCLAAVIPVYLLWCAFFFPEVAIILV